jgi:hypothetical protein
MRAARRASLPASAFPSFSIPTSTLQGLAFSFPLLHGISVGRLLALLPFAFSLPSRAACMIVSFVFV